MTSGWFRVCNLAAREQLAVAAPRALKRNPARVQLMFEKHRPPAVFMAKNAVLSSFATGRQTSVIVDIGHEGTTGAADDVAWLAT